MIAVAEQSDPRLFILFCQAWWDFGRSVADRMRDKCLQIVFVYLSPP